VFFSTKKNNFVLCDKFPSCLLTHVHFEQLSPSETMSEFSSWYASLEKKGGESPDVFRVFARKESSYYTVHGKAALFVADEFFQTRDVVTYSSELAGYVLNFKWMPLGKRPYPEETSILKQVCLTLSVGSMCCTHSCFISVHYVWST
jgi:hypothetical protein